MAKLIVKSEVKRVVADFNVAGDVAYRLNELLEEILVRGQERAKANGRKTLQGKDL